MRRTGERSQWKKKTRVIWKLRFGSSSRESARTTTKEIETPGKTTGGGENGRCQDVRTEITDRARDQRWKKAKGIQLRLVDNEMPDRIRKKHQEQKKGPLPKRSTDGRRAKTSLKTIPAGEKKKVRKGRRDVSSSGKSRPSL